MLFNSYVFMLAFLPLTLLGYFLLGRLPERIPLNKVFLVLASFVFYGYNNPSYVPIIVCSILVNYALSQLMLSCERKAVRLPLMLLGLGLNLGVLFYFKYHDFFVDNLNRAFGSHFSLYHLALPLGISFFTFQQLSYVIDSYRRTVPRYHILDYALFVTFFPQLVAGPIVLHSEIVPQFADPKNRHFNFDNFAPGLYAFALGLFKKVIVADTFGVAVTEGFANALSLNTAEAWFVAIGYTLQLYFDFSGYCDVATGVGLMFNIKIPLNFNSPYKSLSDGERQKVMIAKALAQETPIIFLDEPTAFLDYPSKVDILHLLHRLSREMNKTIFLSTHDLELALQIADQLWLMDRQQGIWTGTPEDLALDGRLAGFFPARGIVFDSSTGLYRIDQAYTAEVRLEGTGCRAAMVQKALRRNGIRAHSEACSTCCIRTGEGTDFQLLDHEGRVTTVRTIRELITTVEELLQRP